MLRKILISTILITVCASITSIAGNIIASLLFESEATILWWSWPIFILSTLAGIALTVWQIITGHENSTQQQQNSNSQNRGRESITERKRDYLLFGMPLFS
ncbi:MAG: hypothetical protein EOM24_14445, partial [Chloroflexia bacterium]|nr:hypothetical protein [Chloroflexia bacterium]